MRLNEDVDITRVVEWLGPIRTVSDLFPTTPLEAWQARSDGLDPTFWSAATGAYRAAIQTFVVRVDGLTIVVDTGIGDFRDRPQVPLLAQLHTQFDEALERNGVRRDDVDFVVNTHIHYDHVGWNTRLVDGQWVPTFPNASYVIPKLDYDYFHPDNSSGMRAAKDEDERRRFEGIRLVFEDSIAPIAAAGQADLWEGSYRISDSAVMAPAPGHTPGSSVLWIAGAAGAAFVGDLMHSPLQIERPQDACAFDLDPGQAAESRRRILQEAAARGAMVFPAHFPGHGAAVITDTDDAFAVQTWADFPSI